MTATPLTVTITITDKPDGTLGLTMEFDPFIEGQEPPQTPAARCAVGILEWIGRRATDAQMDTDS